MDYTDIGLDSSLQPTNSPISKDRGFITSTDVDATYERNTIAGYQVASATIGTLSFNQIAGGTAILGGTSNGNGFLSVRDSQGTEIVRADNTGLTVSNGSIIIQNSGGTNIIDSKGLISTSVFANGQVIKSSSQNTTNTSFESVSSFSLNTINFSRATNVLITCTMTGRHLDFDGILIARLVYNGTAVGPEVIAGQPELTALETSVGWSFIYSAPSGVGTIGAQIRQNNTGGTGVLDASFLASVLNYVALGQ